MRFLITVLLLSIAPVPLFPQAGTGTLTGTVTDTSGAALNGAQITVHEPDAGSGGGISIGGARSEQNAFQLDGVTNSDQWDNGIAFRPSIDAIEEFKIEVNNYSAEFGKGAGG